MSGRFDDRWLSEKVLFPDSRAAADAVLSLYKDKSVIESVSPVETLYTVVPDTLAATRGDQSLASNLQEQFALRLDEVASYYREDVRGRVRTFRSFNHSWALKPWAAHLLSPSTHRPVVLHFDAHDDLGAPMIGITEKNTLFTAPVGASILDLQDGSTVEEFVQRGFIGIGSFMAPLLHAVSDLEIVHIAPDHPAAPEEFELLVEPIAETTFTGRILQRPTVRLAPPTDDSKRRYTRTSDVALAMGRAEGRDLILDIDLDYFCNAFDNKRPAQGALSAHELNGDETARLMIDFQRSLETGGVAPSLVTIALSPGFFPSDQWSIALPCLEEILSTL